jgi:hypothetical protein
MAPSLEAPFLIFAGRILVTLLQGSRPVKVNDVVFLVSGLRSPLTSNLPEIHFSYAELASP